MSFAIAFRPLERRDFSLLERWLSQPHVVKWWREPLDLAGLEEKYGPRIDGRDPTHVFVIELDTKPIGWIQWYRWSDYPEHAAKLGAEIHSAGIDLSIGDEQLLGRGLGSKAISEFLERVVFIQPDITAVCTDPEQENLRSLRAFAKAGFELTKNGYFDGKDYRQCVVRRRRGGRAE